MFPSKAMLFSKLELVMVTVCAGMRVKCIRLKLSVKPCNSVSRFN